MHNTTVNGLDPKASEIDDESGSDDSEDWHSAVENLAIVERVVDKFRDAKLPLHTMRKLKQRARQVRDSDQRKIFNVDYNSSFFEVCQDFTTFAVSKPQSLDFLCRPWAPKGVKEHLPSWIPTLHGLPFDKLTVSRAAGGWKMARMNADPLVGQSSLDRSLYSVTTDDGSRPMEFRR